MKSKTLFTDSCIAIDCLHYCSLSFLSLALLEDAKGEILFYSSQNYLLVKSELNHLKMHSTIFKDFQERVQFNFVKSTLHDARELFFKDFEKSVQMFEGNVIYFDRIDYFLEEQSQKEYQKDIGTFREIVEKNNKKIIFVYNSKSQPKPHLNLAFKKQTALLDFMNTKHKETSMPALKILQDELLEENTKPALTSSSDTKIQVMLMSDDDALKKLHYYIFSSTPDVDYYTIDILPEDEMNILHEMDIVIYNKKDKELKTRILKTIKKENLSLKFFEITQEEYLRQKDLLLANLEGVDKLFKKDFLMEDFVMSIEIYLKSSFYSRRLLTLSDDNIILLSNQEHFQAKIQALLDEKIFFSHFVYKYDADADISSYNIQKIVREYDNILINKRKKEIHFLILNTVPDFGIKLIQERIQNFSISLELKSAKSSFDLIFD